MPGLSRGLLPGSPTPPAPDEPHEQRDLAHEREGPERDSGGRGDRDDDGVDQVAGAGDAHERGSARDPAGSATKTPIVASTSIVASAFPAIGEVARGVVLFGARPMDTYHHVASKDAILDAMVDTVFGEVHLPDASET